MAAPRAAIYLRVSKGEQTNENQRPDVARVVETRRLELVTEYEEKASAAKVRPQFDKMMRDAHRGAFDVLVVWALDRFGRGRRADNRRARGHRVAATVTNYAAGARTPTQSLRSGASSPA